MSITSSVGPVLAGRVGTVRWLRPVLHLLVVTLLVLAGGACTARLPGAEPAAEPGTDAAAADAASAALVDGDPATIQWSNGDAQTGLLRFDQALSIHDGTTLRAIPAAQVLAIELAPQSEAMVQGWRFVEPGQPRKENVGAPYPVRHLQATITTADGTRISGHLTTTVAWLTPPDADAPSRVILPAKQEGPSGQVLADLIYPLRIVFSTHAQAAASRRLRLPHQAPGATVVVISRGSLARSQTRPGAAPGEYLLPAPIEVPAFVACQQGAAIDVAFPPPATPALTALAQGAVDQAQDFLDHRQLLGAWAEGQDQLYGLVMLFRQGSTTMAGDHPWRLEIWRWKREDERLLWAGRAYFFRGLAANVAGLPAVQVHSAWWSQTMDAGVCTLGGDTHGR